LNTFKYFLYLIFCSQISLAQINFENYRLPIHKTIEKIKIDGVLDEITWKEAAAGKVFL